MSRYMLKNGGFTLIETITYLAIYSIIITGALVSAYAIFESAGRNQTKAIAQEEGTYLVGKIDWALTGTQSITAPAAGGVGSVLQVIKYDSTVGNPVVITFTNGTITLSRGGNAPQVLNNSNVTITCPPTGCLSHESASGDGINQESVSASFTVHATTSTGIPYSQDFSTTKYVRK